MSSPTLGARAPIQRLQTRLLAVLGALALAATMVVPLGTPASAQEEQPDPTTVQTDRFDGEDRHETACMIAEETFGTSDTVLIARADDYFDALSGNYLAGQWDVPILLAPFDHVDEHTDACLEDLGVDNVTLLGGEAVLSEDLEDELDDAGYEVDRIAGENRHETAQLVAEAGDTYGEVDGERTAIVASGHNFPDALVSGGVAYDGEFPLLLTIPDELDAWTEAALEGLDIDHVLIPGGTGAVSQDVEDDINDLDITTQRFSGERRTDTATMVTDFAIDELDWTRDHVNLARGDFFPDALTVGPHAGVEQAGILLTWHPDALDGPVAHTEDWLREHACDIFSLHLAGGDAAISDEVEDEAREAAEDCDLPPAPDSLTLDPAEATNAVGTDHALTATVTDEDGDGVDDAEVRFEATGTVEESTTSTTDADGEATFTYSSDQTGDDTIVACTTPAGEAPPTCEDHEQIDLTDQATKTWEEGATVTGTVEDHHDTPRSEEPIEDATVTAFDGDEVVATTTTDPDGTYELVLGAGTYELVADHDDFTSDDAEVTLDWGDEEQVDFGLYPLADPPEESTATAADADDVDIVADGDFWRVPLVIDGVERNVDEYTDTIVYERPEAETIELGTAGTDASYWTRGDGCESGFAEGDHILYYDVEHADVDDGWYRLTVTFDDEGCLVAVNGEAYTE